MIRTDHRVSIDVFQLECVWSSNEGQPPLCPFHIFVGWVAIGLGKCTPLEALTFRLSAVIFTSAVSTVFGPHCCHFTSVNELLDDGEDKESYDKREDRLSPRG